MKRIYITALALAFLFASAGTALPQTTALTGVWTITLSFISGKATHTATIAENNGALSGTYKGSNYEGRLSGTVKGNTVTFTGSVKIQAQTVSFSYTGTIEGGVMKGTVDMGEYWTGTWTAKKAEK